MHLMSFVKWAGQRGTGKELDWLLVSSVRSKSKCDPSAQVRISASLMLFFFSLGACSGGWNVPESLDRNVLWRTGTSVPIGSHVSSIPDISVCNVVNVLADWIHP